MVGAAAGGARSATVAIVIRAQDMASKVFQRVGRSAGGAGGAFKMLGLGVMRLLGPLGNMAFGLQMLIPLLAGVTVGLTTRKWLQWRDALGQAKFQLGLLGNSMQQTNDLVRIVSSTLDRQTAISFFNNKKAVTNLSRALDQDLLQAILLMSQKLTDAFGPTHDYFNILIEAERTGNLSAVKQVLLGIVDNVEGMGSLAEVMGALDKNLKNLEPSNVEKVADKWASINESMTSIFGPFGDILAAGMMPFLFVLDLVLKGIDNVRLSLGFWLEPIGLVIKFAFNLGLAATGLMKIEDVLEGSKKSFKEWKDQWDHMWELTGKQLKDTFNGWVALFETWIGKFFDLFDPMMIGMHGDWEELSKLWDAIWDTMGEKFQGFIDWIEPKWSGFMGVIDSVLGTLQAIGGILPGNIAGGGTGGVGGLFGTLGDWLGQTIGVGMQSGGIVPGPIGSPVPTILHGGERVIPVSGGGGGGTVIVPLSIGGNMLGELIINTIHRTAKFESGVVSGAIGGGTAGLR